jgi:competence protein ComFB
METALKIHNLAEDAVIKAVDAICDEIEQNEQNVLNGQSARSGQCAPGRDVCTCDQCRLDAACYVLNRVKPSYVVSNRGAVRVGLETLERQQGAIDIKVLIYQALEKVGHNRRPYFDHQSRTHSSKPQAIVFNIPAVVGRVFNGLNFEPVSGTDVELWRDGEREEMRDSNWQNPFRLIKVGQGMFMFWPKPVEAEMVGEQRVFEFSVKIKAEGFETLNTFFEIPAVSEACSDVPFSADRTFKLQDMYLFPEEAEEYTGYTI